MASQAQVYDTTAVVAATPSRAVVVQVATVNAVAVSAYNTQVRFIGFIQFTPGADTTSITLEVRRNTITGTQTGADTTYAVVPAVSGLYSIMVAGSAPQGLHGFSICLTQTGASADGTVQAVGLLAIVGN